MSTSAPVLTALSLSKSYLERPVLSGVTFSIHEGERVGLLGANGSGKTTLMGILTGDVAAESGEVRLRRGLTVSRLRQDVDLPHQWTIGQTLSSAFDHVHRLEEELDRVHRELEHTPAGEQAQRLLHRQGELQERLHLHDHHTLQARKQEAMNALGIPPEERLLGELSGGELRRTGLCRVLLEEPDLLLLDEPTNHLDAQTLDWLEDYLRRFRGTVLLVTHDRYFLDRITTRLLELQRGTVKSYQGNYSDYLLAKEQEAELAERAEATRRNLLRRELEWLRRQPKARTTKSKARIDAAAELMAGGPPPPDGSIQLLIPSGPRLGKTLLEAEGLTHELDGRTLIRDFSFMLRPGDRVGVVGRNGLGKTTLLRLLMKELEPQQGTVHHGSSIKFVYADQARETLDPDATVLEEVAGDLEYVNIGGRNIGFRAWLERFLFDEQTARMPIRLLSGGERNRVQLAKMLREGGNVVVLDEPTNDLDLPTLRILEEALARFEGCAFVVSHDRYFLDRVATRIIGFRGDGRIDVVEGNYRDYRTYLERTGAMDQPATPAKEPATKPRSAAANSQPASAARKLSYKEQLEFDGLEERIMQAEERVEELTALLEDPATHRGRPPEEAAALGRELEAAKAGVDQLYERWAELGARAR